MKRYVSERIGDDYLNWQVGKNVLISTPTGSGKTTFVIEVLLRHAIRQGKHVVYYCNRRILNDQFSVISEERIKKMYSGSGDISAEEALSYLHIFTYQYMERLKTLHMAILSGQRGHNPGPLRAIIGGQPKT